MRSDFNSYKTGLRAEFIARMFLRFRGYKILCNRYVTGKNTNRAEIDIIARRGNAIVFIEVKSRPTLDAGWKAITTHQAARLRCAAETYLMKRQWRGSVRFDVIIVCGWRVHWAKNVI